MTGRKVKESPVAKVVAAESRFRVFVSSRLNSSLDLTTTGLQHNPVRQIGDCNSEE